MTLAVLTGAAASAVAQPADLPGKLDEYVRSFAESGLFSGVVLVQRDGQTIYRRAYGVAERSFATPLAVDARFQIASLSKPVTAAAIGRLVDQGKLDFDAPVSRYLENIPNGDQITIEQLLTHYSGLESPDRLEGSESWMRLPNTTAQLVDRVRAAPPPHSPGERYYYSNGNYWILAHLIERLSGLTYGEFLRREIFEPVGMLDSGHRGDALLIVTRLAGGYAPEGLSSYRLANPVDWTSKTGNGSLYSTVDDMARFYNALSSGRLLSSETTRRVLGVGRPIGYGWFHRDDPDPRRRAVFFNGRSPGYTAHLEAYPETGLSFIILSNLYVYSPTIMAAGIAKMLRGDPYELQQPIRTVAVHQDALRPFEGTYVFGPDFYVRNGRVEIVARGDHLFMRWAVGGLTSTLLPTGENTFFDPTFWANIRFEDGPDGRMFHYLIPDDTRDHQARRETPAAS